MEISEIMYSYGLCVLSIILIIFIVYLQLKIKKNDIRQWCMLFLMCALIANISDLFQIANFRNFDLGIIFEGFCYIGQAMFPICVFFAIAYYIEPNFKFKKKHLFLFCIPIITILGMFTNNFHGLMFKNYSVNFSDCEYGIMFYVYIADVYITYILSFVMILRYLYKKQKEALNKIIGGAVAFIIPSLIYILGILGIIDAKVYIAEVTQSIIACGLIYMVFKFEIIIELPISISTVLNSISDSYVVIDDKKKIVMYNKVFLEMFDLGVLDIKEMDFLDLIEYKEFDTIFEDDVQKVMNLNKYKENKIISFERNSDRLEKTLKYECEILEKNKKGTFYLIFVTETTEYTKNIQYLKLNHEILIRKRAFSITSAKWLEE